MSGTMERFDLSYETLCDHNPGLIYASIRGFGDPRTGETEPAPGGRAPLLDEHGPNSSVTTPPTPMVARR